METHKLRKSQQEAIDKTIAYFKNFQTNENVYLWNAVMRWGKCLTSLNFIDQFNKQEKDKPIKNVLILTFFPQTEDSWSRLFEGGVEAQDNFKDFNLITVNSKDQKPKKDKVNIFFASFQEVYTGKDRKQFLYSQNYDLLILDEYHHGAYNTKAKGAMKQLKEINYDNFDTTFSQDEVAHSEEIISKLHFTFKLVLSGTPYKTFRIDGFNKSNTFTFSYFDEQRDRVKNGINSDYYYNPAINLYSVRLKPEAKGENALEERVKFLLHNDLFFSSSSRKSFFSINPHPASFWLIPSVKDAKDIENYIKYYDTKDEYNVINLYSKKYEKNSSNTLDMVREDLKSSKKKNIILSFNKLTLGVTIQEIESVVFLREITTPELYMQAASRSKSQYPNGFIKKENVPLVSFDRNVDFNIFSQITNTKYSRENEDITESEFLKLLPIYFIDYNSESDSYEIQACDETESFLNALADVSIDEIIKKSVSPFLESIKDIPADLLDALNNISEIGGKRKAVSEEHIPKTEKEIAMRDAYAKGKSDKLHNLNKDTKVPERYSKYQKDYENEYLRGYSFEPLSVKEKKQKEEKEKDENLSSIRQKVELLIRRFIYVMIATYFVEGKFIDIEDADESFFESLLGFKKHHFLKLHELYLLNNDYIDSVINNFRSVENLNTNHAGLNKMSDYDITILDEEDLLPETPKVDISEIDFEKLKEAIKEISKVEETREAGTKYIYIATPSKWIVGLRNTLGDLLKQDLKIKQLREVLEGYFSFVNDLTRGVKIGETSRIPTERLEELNGYTRKIDNSYILFDMFYYTEVPSDVTDVQFHKYLEENKYERVKDDIRREIFNITNEKAKEELEKFIYELKNKDKVLSKFTSLSSINLQLIDLHKNPLYYYKYNEKEAQGDIHEIYKEILTWYYGENRKDFFSVILKNQEFGFDPSGGTYTIKIAENVYVHNYPANKRKMFELLNLFVSKIEKDVTLEVKEKFASTQTVVDNSKIKEFIKNKKKDQS